MIAMPGAVFGQSVHGRVTDAVDSAPLANVSVVLRGTSTGVATNQRGEFSLRLPVPGTHVLVFRHLGFQTQSRTVTVRFDERIRVDVELEPVVIGAEEVIVQARALAAADAARSVETLDTGELRADRGQTLGDALQHIAGVTTLSTGPSIDKPIVRGMHSERVVLVNNGVRQEGQQWGREHAPEVDPFAPVEVSILKGAAGVEYGAGAIGGVLRLTPLPLPDSTGVGGSLDLDAFSNNGQGAGSLLLEGARAVAGGLWSWRTQGSLRVAGASQTPDYVIGNTAFRENNLSVATTYRRGHWTVEATASRFDSELGIFSGAHVNTVEAWENIVERSRPAIDYNFSYDIDAPKQEVRHDLATLGVEHRMTNGYRVEAKYGIQRNLRREFDAHSPGGGPPSAPGVELTLMTHSVDASLRSPAIDAAGGALIWSAGLAGMNQGNENGRASYLIPNYRALSGGVFTRSTWSRDRWTVDAGARLDHQWSRSFPRDNGGTTFLNRTQSFWGGSGVFSVTSELDPAWEVSLAASTAWRPPGFSELYSDGVHHGSAQYEEGRADLGAERAWALDATLRHHGERTRLQLGVYETRVDDFINLVPSGQPKVTIRGVFPLFRYEQRDAILRGVDGWAEIDVAEPVTLGLTASIVRGTDRLSSEPLADMPSDRGSLFADLRVFHRPVARSLRTVRLRIDGHRVTRQTRYPENVDFAPPPAGYALLDVSLHSDWRVSGVPMSLQLATENVFDTRYRDYLDRMRYFTDASGRTVILRLHVKV